MNIRNCRPSEFSCLQARASARQLLIFLISLAALSCSERSSPVAPVQEPLVHEPWEDYEAEYLACLISGKLSAPRDIYERVRAELTEIRSNWGDSIPRVREIRFSPPMIGDIGISVDPDVYQEMTNGEYHDWDSLNQMLDADLDVSQGYVHVGTFYRINIWRMLQAYDQLRGVRSVWPNTYRINGPRLYASFYHWGIGYLYRDTDRLFYFRSYADGIRYVGEWVVRDDPEPSWWSEAHEAEVLWREGDAEYRFRNVTPPARVDDLRIIGVQYGTAAEFRFTATGDDGYERQPETYVFRWGPQPIDSINWPLLPYLTFPAQPPGTQITVRLTALADSGTNYVAVRTIDRHGNVSEVSNVVASQNVLQFGWTYFNSSNSAFPASEVITLLRDSRGRTWAGTKNGMACFSDGLWTTYTTANSGIPSNHVTAIGEDLAGNIWVGTMYGAASFDGTTWTPRNPPAGHSPSNEIRSIVGAADGSVWLGVHFSGAARFDGTDWTWFDTTTSGIGGTLVKTMLLARDGALWFGTEQGLSRYDGSNWILHRPNGEAQAANYVMAILEDQSGSIWCGTFGGRLNRLVEGGWTSQTMTAGESWPRHTASVNNIVQTTNGDIWVTTYGSIRWYMNGDPDSVMTLLPSNCGLPERDITALAVGPDNTLWIGTKNSGVCRWDLTQAGL